MITQQELLKLLNENKNLSELRINGEYYNYYDLKAIENAFKSGYNKTLSLKINGYLIIKNGELIK